jgi:hypothetical protein
MAHEPLTSDWLTDKLSAAQQKVMSLTVENRTLGNKLKRANAQSEALYELIMEIAEDLADGVAADRIDYKIGKTMQRLGYVD